MVSQLAIHACPITIQLNVDANTALTTNCFSIQEEHIEATLRSRNELILI